MPSLFGPGISPPYKLSKVALGGSILWTADLPYTQIGPPYANPAGTLYVPLADLSRYLNSDDSLPVDLYFVTVREGRTSDPIKVKLADLNQGWSPNLLYPPDPCRFGERDQKAIANLNLLEWTTWPSFLYAGHAYPDAYAAIDGGGFVAGILWHETSKGITTAIPKWSQSPQLAVIDVSTGKPTWQLDGSKSFPDKYELYTSILITQDGKLLVHFERFEWENIDYQVFVGHETCVWLSPGCFGDSSYDNWFNCALPDPLTLTPTGAVDGINKVFTTTQATYDFTPPSYGADGMEGAFTSFFQDQLFVNSCNLPYTRVTLRLNSTSVLITYTLGDAPPLGSVVRVAYRDCVTFSCGFPDVAHGGSGLGAHGNRSCCDCDPTTVPDCPTSLACTQAAFVDTCWWKQWFGPGYPGGGFNGGNPDLCGNCFVCGPGNIGCGAGGCGPDPAGALDALNQITTKMNAGLVTHSQIPTPVKWIQGYRTYDVETGVKISEILVQPRECQASFQKYNNWEVKTASVSYTGYPVGVDPTDNVTISPTLPTVTGQVTYVGNVAFLFESSGTGMCYESDGMGGYTLTLACDASWCQLITNHDSSVTIHATMLTPSTIDKRTLVETALTYVPTSVLQDQSRKLPWRSYNAACDDQRIYFSPGDTLPPNVGIPNTSTDPGGNI